MIQYFIFHGVRRAAYLWCQAFEESSDAFRNQHFLDNLCTTDIPFEVRILDTRLDNVERRSDRDGRDSTGDGRDEVLCPGRF